MSANIFGCHTEGVLLALAGMGRDVANYPTMQGELPTERNDSAQDVDITNIESYQTIGCHKLRDASRILKWYFKINEISVAQFTWDDPGFLKEYRKILLVPCI